MPLYSSQDSIAVCYLCLKTINIFEFLTWDWNKKGVKSVCFNYRIFCELVFLTQSNHACVLSDLTRTFIEGSLSCYKQLSKQLVQIYDGSQKIENWIDSITFSVSYSLCVRSISNKQWRPQEGDEQAPANVQNMF